MCFILGLIVKLESGHIWRWKVERPPTEHNIEGIKYPQVSLPSQNDSSNNEN